MKLHLRHVTAIESREEVFVERKKRRGRGARGETWTLRSARVPKLPQAPPELLRFRELRREVDLSDRATAWALGITTKQLVLLENGELAPVEPGDWDAACDAIQRAAVAPATGPST